MHGPIQALMPLFKIRHPSGIAKEPADFRIIQ
jgi:hypothetical protein